VYNTGAHSQAALCVTQQVYDGSLCCCSLAGNLSAYTLLALLPSKLGICRPHESDGVGRTTGTGVWQGGAAAARHIWAQSSRQGALTTSAGVDPVCRKPAGRSTAQPTSLQVIDCKVVVDKPARGPLRPQRVAECTVGDETGTILFSARNEQGEVPMICPELKACLS
jgi:hypothetical protein